MPRLYVLTAVATNNNGYTSTSAIYVAVTNIPDSIDLSGTYARSSNSQKATITKKARGLYVTDNVGGVVPPSAAVVPAAFAQLDSTTLVLPTQPTGEGPLSASNMTLSYGPPITISYVVINGAFGTSTRTFVKQ